MTNHCSKSLLLVLILCVFASPALVATTCDGPRIVREAALPKISGFVRNTQKTVLTFAGYSGAGYQHPEVMLEQASRILKERDPARILINIGATAEGIGAVYDVAKQMGFTTMGVVSTMARDNHATLSKCVDYVFYVKDDTWGGKVSGGDHLSPTSTAILAVSSSFVGIGGGDIARDELSTALRLGKPVIFISAELNHKIAREKAQKRGETEPTDFRGTAHAELVEGARSSHQYGKIERRR